MDLTTDYLGLKLNSPIIVGASPLIDNPAAAKLLEHHGAGALVMHSLFEEQLTAEQVASHQAIEASSHITAEATNFFPDPENYRLGPEDYLSHLRLLKEAVSIPVIASLNGTSLGGWIDYAKQLADAGADALELNIYYLPTSMSIDSADVEKLTCEMVRYVRRQVQIPVAVKLSANYTSLPSMAKKLEDTDVNGLVLFNRYFEPDIDPEHLEVTRSLRLSSRDELAMRLRWLAILSGRLNLSLACTGGVHTAEDVVKAILAGADAVQVVSAIYAAGYDIVGKLAAGLKRWLSSHDYQSLDQARGSMGLLKVEDPTAYERANYVKILQTWREQPMGG